LDALPLLTELSRLSRIRERALEALIAPARAAANQMKDAGMANGADALNAALFRLDATDGELKTLTDANPKQLVEALIASFVAPE
jgi:hypothetical protein